MCLGDRRAQLGTCDVHVRFERRRAGVGPEIHHPSSVVGSGELVHLIEPEAWALEVGSSRVDPGAGLLAGIDVVLDSEIAEAIQIATGAHRRHSTGQVESRKALGQVGVDAGTGRVEEVLVDHHESGDHRLCR